MTPSSKKGFTLIETILYVALATVILYGISSLYAVMIVMHAKHRAMTDVSLASEHALLLITQTIRDARTVTAPEIGQASTELSLEMHDGAPYPTETISILEGVIMMQDGSQPPIPLTPSNIVVSELQFTNMSTAPPHSIRVSFTASSNSGDRADLAYSDTFYATATTR